MNFIRFIKQSKSLSWRLISHFFIFCLIITMFGCFGKKDENEAVTPVPNPDPDPVVVEKDCNVQGAYYVTDLFTGATNSNELHLSFIDNHYKGHIGGQVKATAIIEHRIFPNDETTSAIFFWNIGSNIYMAVEETANVVGYVDLAPLRGTVTSLAAVKNGNYIGVIAGTTHGLAYIISNPTNGAMEVQHRHRFPLTFDLEGQIGINSIFVDYTDGEADNVYLTTTNRDIIRTKFQHIKEGTMGCFDLVATQRTGDSSDEKLHPIKSTVVKHKNREYLIYLAQERRSLINNKPTPYSDETIHYHMLRSMVDESVYTKLIAVDLKTGEKIDIQQGSHDSWDNYDRWIPLDITVKTGQLIVGALTFEDTAFNEIFSSGNPCDHTASYSDHIKTSCLLDDGVLNAEDGSTKADGIEAINDGDKNLTHALYIYEIPENVEDLGIDNDNLTDGQKIFSKAKDVERITFTQTHHDKVSPLHFKIFSDGSHIYARGTNQLRILDNDFDPVMSVSTGTEIDNDEILKVGIPHDISGVSMGSKIFMIHSVKSIDGHMISTNGTGVVESLEASYNGNWAADKLSTIASGFDAPKLSSTDSGNDLLYIKPISGKFGKIYKKDIFSQGTYPKWVKTLIYSGDNMELAEHVAYGNAMHCFDAYKASDLDDIEEIKIECRSDTNYAYGSKAIDVSTDSLFSGFPAVEDENTYLRRVGDIKIFGDKLFVVFKGYNGGTKYYYRVAMFNVDKSGGSINIDLLGSTSVRTHTYQTSSAIGIDESVKILFTRKKPNDDQHEGYIATAGGLLYFKIDEDSGSISTNQTLEYKFQDDDPKRRYVTMAIDFEKALLINILKQEAKIEIRNLSHPDVEVVNTIEIEDTKGYLAYEYIPEANAIIEGDNLYLSLNATWLPNNFYIIDIANPDSPSIQKEAFGSHILDIRHIDNSRFITSSIGNGIEIFDF